VNAREREIGRVKPSLPAMTPLSPMPEAAVAEAGLAHPWSTWKRHCAAARARQRLLLLSDRIHVRCTRCYDTSRICRPAAVAFHVHLHRWTPPWPDCRRRYATD